MSSVLLQSIFFREKTMYTVRIIPCLDVKEGKVVKGIHFKNLRYAGDPVKLAKRYSDDGADEIVFLDITATIEKRKTIFDVVTRTAENVFVPLTVGGGVKTVEDVRALLNAGADKVAINTAAVKNPQLVKDAAKQFGSQCIVVAIDAKRVSRVSFSPTLKFLVADASVRCNVGLQRRQTLKGWLQQPAISTRGKWEVYINAGRTPTGIDVLQWAKKVEHLGAGEILLTSIDADGTKEGYDIELTNAVVNTVTIPVVASGGAGKIEHLVEVVKKVKPRRLSAVLAASIFHYQEHSVQKVRREMISAGIPVKR